MWIDRSVPANTAANSTAPVGPISGSADRGAEQKQKRVKAERQDGRGGEWADLQRRNSKMTHEPTQAEKLAILKNDTLLRRAANAEPGMEKPNVIGSGVLPEYPGFPSNSPWACNPCGAEPPLGFAIDEQEPVGTPAEIERSLKVRGA